MTDTQLTYFLICQFIIGAAFALQVARSEYKKYPYDHANAFMSFFFITLFFIVTSFAAVAFVFYKCVMFLIMFNNKKV